MRFKKKLFVVLFFIMALASGGGYYYWSIEKNSETGKNSRSSSDSPDKFYTVKRGDMIIGIHQAGFINSQKKHKLAFEPHIKTKLLWVIDENTKVKKGDILAKFETDELTDKIDQLKLDIDNLEKELAIAIEAKKILVSTNKSSIRAAMDKVTMAEDAFKKYRNFERSKKRDSLNLALEKANKSYDDSVDSYDEKKDAIDSKGSADAETVKKDQLELSNLKQKREDAKNSLKNAELDLKVFKRYTHPNKITSLTNQLDQAKLEYNKVKIQTASQVLQKDKSINNLKIRLKRQREKLIKYSSYVEHMTLSSPVDGVVIYGDPDRRWGNPEIKLGMDIRRKQVLLTIPDMSKLIVEFDLPELYRSKVKLGDKVVITPESLKNIKINGKLSKIPQLPVNQIHWDRNSPKIYKKSMISLDVQSSRLVCGMSVQLEVITQVLRNAVYIPIEAVREEGGKYFVYKRSGFKAVRQSVTIGKANDNYAQILDGLEEKDVIYLYKPFQKKQDKS